MFYYNDDDIEKTQTNWKNSEVMRIFAEQYLDKLQEVAPIAQPAIDSLPPETSTKVATDNVSVARTESRRLVEAAMQKLADLSAKYGNEKVKYELDRAKAELEKILLTGENDVLQ
jgi:hypothetical protein